MAAEHTCKCSPARPGVNSRNLVVCIDGTSNRFGTKNTNIVELYSHIVKSDEQLTYYSSGLGAIAKVTGTSLKRRMSNAIDMAVGSNLQKVIMDAYRWLSDNFRDGDKIYLFGFSRGAYQVRAIAGMIARVGLILPGNNEQIPFAFEVYSAITENSGTLEQGSLTSSGAKGTQRQDEQVELAETFKRTFSRRDVRVHFVGVWDTVSSVGFGRGNTLPSTTSSCDHICFFRHALALDERRVKFLPEYVYGGRAHAFHDDHVKEVWFAGSHSDVGGGNRRNEYLQSGDIPLLWMRSQAMTAGLSLEAADVTWKISDLEKPITPSLMPQWWFLELLPLKRLLYYNSNAITYKPHMGGPRRILPGQKVHVSVLFKTNYKPYAQFLGKSEEWPGPMFWNDPNSHQRLQNLPDSLWEKDIFDDHSIESLLKHLAELQTRQQANLDAVDRLAFMVNFNLCRDSIKNAQGVKDILTSLLYNNADKFVRLSAAVTYCELDWDWPPRAETEKEKDLTDTIARDVSDMLHGDKTHEQSRACISLPSLCKQWELGQALLKDENLKRIIDLCDSTRTTQRGENTSSVAFHSAQALSMLMSSNYAIAHSIVRIQAVSNILQALQDDYDPVLVCALKVVACLADHGGARDVFKSNASIATLVAFAHRFDDFVAPRAVEVLRLLLPDEELRTTMLRLGILDTLTDMLSQCSDDIKKVGSQALAEMVKYEDMRNALLKDGLIDKLARHAHSHPEHRRNGAILGLVALSKDAFVKDAVQGAMRKAGTVKGLVAWLRQGAHALVAASALAQLMDIDDVVTTLTADGADAPGLVVSMFKRRWFDGSHGEDGIGVLRDILEHEPFRKAVLASNAVDRLLEMLESGNEDTVYAGLQYLRILSEFDDGKAEICRPDMIEPTLASLRIPRQAVQWSAIVVLHILFHANDMQEMSTRITAAKANRLREGILDGLRKVLRSRRSSEVLGVSMALRIFSVDEEVQRKVVTDPAFWRLSHDYYNTLHLEYDRRGPCFGDVYESVGAMITSMQEKDGHRPSKDLAQLTSAAYEPRPKVGPGVSRLTTLLCCPAYLLCRCGVGGQDLK